MASEEQQPVLENEEAEDQAEMNKFFSLDRNYIILTNSGKPVFSAYGDMYTLSSVYATLYAIVSKAQTYECKPIDLTELIDSSGNPILISDTKSERVLDPADTDETMLHEGKKKKGIVQKLLGGVTTTEKKDLVGTIDKAFLERIS